MLDAIAAKPPSDPPARPHRPVWARDPHPDARIQHAPRLRTIVHEGEDAQPLLFVVSGWLAQSKTLNNGATAIVDLLLPGDLIRVASCRSGVAAHSVIALSAADYTLFDDDRTGGSGVEAMRLRAALAATAVASQARAAELILRLGRGSAAMRIAFMLVELHVRLEGCGQIDGETCGRTGRSCYDIPLSQAMIGQFTGLSNVHVCRTLRRLARAGVVTGVDHHIEIHDLDALCAIADLDLDAFRAEILPQRPQ